MKLKNKYCITQAKLGGLLIMDRTKTKGISFAPQYEREYNYVMEINNASKYICELIKKDLDFKKNKTINNDSHNM